MGQGGGKRGWDLGMASKWGPKREATCQRREERAHAHAYAYAYKYPSLPLCSLPSISLTTHPSNPTRASLFQSYPFPLLNSSNTSYSCHSWTTTKRKLLLPHHPLPPPTLIIFLVPRIPLPCHLLPQASLALFSPLLLPLLEGEIQGSRRWDSKIMEHQVITVKVKAVVATRMRQWSPAATTVHQSTMVVKKIIPQKQHHHQPGPLNPTMLLRKIRKMMIPMVTTQIAPQEETGGKVPFIIDTLHAS